MITLGDIAGWIVINRKKTSFKNFSYEQLVMFLSEKSNKDELLVILDGDSIAGIICYTPKSNNELFVDDILTTKPGVVKEMLEVCKHKFPNYHITGIHRTGRNRRFLNQDKLKRRI